MPVNRRLQPTTNQHKENQIMTTATDTTTTRVRRSPEQIEDLQKAVKKAVGRKKDGKKSKDILIELAAAGVDAKGPDVQKAIKALCENGTLVNVGGKTRSAAYALASVL